MSFLFALLKSPSALIAAIASLLQLFLVTALVPYAFARPNRRAPVGTYIVMGLNVLLFVLGVFVANINLPQDKGDGVRAASQLLKPADLHTLLTAASARAAGQSDEAAPPAADNAAANAAPGATATPAAAPAPTPAAAAPGGATAGTAVSRADIVTQLKKLSPEALAFYYAALKAQALPLAQARAGSVAGWRTLWKIEHLDATFVVDPHYSVAGLFGYSPARIRPWGLLGSPFLQAGFLALMGSLLYLWLCGGALEEIMGSTRFVAAYLACGVAATLLYHGAIKVMAPDLTGAVFFGGTAAVASLLGLMTIRFPRSRFKTYQLPQATVGIGLAVGLAGGLAGSFLLTRFGGELATPGGFFGGFLVAWVGYIIFQRQTDVFESQEMAVPTLAGLWLLAFAALPVVADMMGTSKRAAAAGLVVFVGFGAGCLWAQFSSSKGESALEYELEDARKDFDSGDTDSALERAESLIAREPGSAGAYEVIAKTKDARGDEEAALDNYELAIKKYLQVGERATAAELYLHSLKKNPGFILEPKIQFVVASEMERNAQHKEAADNLAKIPFTYPEAPEGELSLLRAAQIYVDQLNELEMAGYLLRTMLERYPETQWMVQVQRILKMADYKSQADAAAAAQASAPAAPAPSASPANPGNRPQAQLPQIKS